MGSLNSYPPQAVPPPAGGSDNLETELADEALPGVELVVDKDAGRKVDASGPWILSAGTGEAERNKMVARMSSSLALPCSPSAKLPSPPASPPYSQN